MNSLFQSLQPNNMAQIKNMMKLVKSNGSPTQLLQSMSQNNPQLKQVMTMVNGKNPKDVFYELAKQKGVNPEDVLKELNS